MKKKYWSMPCLVLVCIMLMTACSAPAAPAAPAASAAPEAPAASAAPADSGSNAAAPTDDGKVYEFRWAIAWPASNTVNANLVPWVASELDKRTNGRVKITIYHGGELLDQVGMYEGVVNNIADIGSSRFASTPGRFPIMSAYEMPGLVFNNAYAANYAYNEMYQKYMSADVADTHLLWIDSTSPGYLYTKAPVNTLADLKNKQIRGDGLVGEAIAALGAAPVSIPINEVYLALENGVIDGIFDRFGGLYNNKVGEVTKYMVIARGIYPGAVFFNTMNKQVWDSLPADIQQAFTEVSAEAYEYSAKLFWDFENDGIQFGYDNKMELIVLSDEEQAAWLEAVKPVEQKWIDANTTADFDAAAFMQDFKAVAQKYNAQFSEKWPPRLAELYGASLQ